MRRESDTTELRYVRNRSSGSISDSNVNGKLRGHHCIIVPKLASSDNLTKIIGSYTNAGKVGVVEAVTPEDTGCAVGVPNSERSSEVNVVVREFRIARNTAC